MLQEKPVISRAVRDVMARGFARKQLLPRKTSLQGGPQILRSLTNAELSKRAGIAAGLISYFRQGTRVPSESQAIEIAGAFFPRQSGSGVDPLKFEREAFLSELLAAATNTASTAASDNILADLAQGRTKLKLSTAEYSPLSGSPECLFEKLATRLFDYCGVPYLPPEIRLHFESNSVSDNEVLLSTFDSPDRILQLKFWRVPLRMSLGAVCHERRSGKSDRIARVLTNLSSRGDELLRPIVLRNSVGWSHCLKRLKFTEAELLTVPRKPGDPPEKTLAEALTREVLDTTKDGTPVVCGDEFTCFKVLNLLGGSGIPVFLMNSRRLAEETGPRRETPQYYISIAIKRGNESFREYIQDVLVQFLSTEIQTTANMWHLLGRMLINQIRSFSHFPQPLTDSPICEAERWRLAWEWVKFTLHMDRTSIDAYTDPAGLPWKPILYRARQLMHNFFAEECGPIIESQVKLQAGSSAEVDQDGFLQLKELFDIDAVDPEPVPTTLVDVNAFLLKSLGKTCAQPADWRN